MNNVALVVRMTRYISLSLICLLLTYSVYSQTNPLPTPPEGYSILYSQDFKASDAINDFEMTDPSAWRIEKSGALELFGKSDYRARVRSPFNIALIKNKLFGDFTMYVKLAQTGREYGHRDLCLFFGAQNSTNFYYVHIASVADDHANNIFLVNDEPRVKIATKTTEGTNWGETGSWHTVKIERKLADGSIKIYFDNMENPIMEATDQHFDIGRIGFGSFDDTGMFDNILIYGPKLHEGKMGFFR